MNWEYPIAPAYEPLIFRISRLFSLVKIKSCIKITGFVNSVDAFTDQPKVINPASELLVKLFDAKGKHTRAAVSVNSLPLGAAVEIDAIFET